MLSMLDDPTGRQLVRSIVFCDFKPFIKRSKETDELIGQGYLGLTKALKQYDAKYMVSFVNFACAKIKQSIIEYIRLESTKNALITCSFLDWIDGERVYYTEERAVETTDFVSCLMNCLTKEEKKIIHRTYWQDESERDIARDLNVSKIHVHLTKTYALQKMRDRGNFLLKKGGLN